MKNKLHFALILVLILMSQIASAQKRKSSENIVNSKDIAEIEAYIKSANPYDPKLPLLKSKVIALKNASWAKNGKNAKPMAARPIIEEVPKGVMQDPTSSEAEEFKKLVAETSAAHKEKTVKLLNQLFDQDMNSKEAALLIQNNSDCNMIVRIQGEQFFNLAVPAHGENSIVLAKGNYSLTSNVCGAKYTAQKDVRKSMVVILNNPTYKGPAPKGK